MPNPGTQGAQQYWVEDVPLPTNAATAAKQPALGIAGTPSTDVLSVQGVASGTVLPVSGTVTANAGTGTLAVSGPLTDTQLRATAVPVSGTVTANAGTGTLAVSGPLTDTQLRATAVPVSGTVTANAGTGTFQVGDAGALINLDVAGDVQVDVLTLPPLVAGTANIGDVDVLTLPALVAGTANIGDVDVLTLPALVAGTANIGDVDIASIAAGDANIGNVDIVTMPNVTLAAATARIGGTYDVGGQIIDEVPTVRTVNRAFVNASLIGNTAVVAAQGAGVLIRVLSLVVVTTLANTVKFQSATTDITAGFPLGANGGMVLNNNSHGWFQTAANAALNINLSVATATGCNVTWVQAA